eukprot:TRINITY_DN10278_c0_g1_i2.p1 TRINITY_DN10278_c0_g1~~TRINITY_DN10278_c0_g1_i2.p1  ORF type:complete len:304 (-),score=128.94 TRINITY_DN10278_c0_g1_i2:42-953(-)
MLASECPGWICYAEKTHGDFVLPFISSTKSPQQIMGTIVKEYFAKKREISPESIYHACVMPCYDKKLEASRDDFYNDLLKTRDVDTVLASMEIVDMIRDRGVDFKNLEESPIDQIFTNVDDEGNLFGISGSAGGYLDFILKYAARELFQLEIGEIQFQNISRRGGSDLRMATVTSPQGETLLTFVAAYGFNNIQHVIKELKKSNCTYHYVEVMACPGACLNGGGQVRPEKNENPKKLLRRVEETYDQQKSGWSGNLAEIPEKSTRNLYENWLNGIFSADAVTKLHTQYHAREKLTTNPLLINW